MLFHAVCHNSRCFLARDFGHRSKRGSLFAERRYRSKWSIVVFVGCFRSGNLVVLLEDFRGARRLLPVLRGQDGDELHSAVNGMEDRVGSARRRKARVEVGLRARFGRRDGRGYGVSRRHRLATGRGVVGFVGLRNAGPSVGNAREELWGRGVGDCGESRAPERRPAGLHGLDGNWKCPGEGDGNKRDVHDFERFVDLVEMAKGELDQGFRDRRIVRLRRTMGCGRNHDDGNDRTGLASILDFTFGRHGRRDGFRRDSFDSFEPAAGDYGDGCGAESFSRCFDGAWGGGTIGHDEMVLGRSCRRKRHGTGTCGRRAACLHGMDGNGERSGERNDGGGCVFDYERFNARLELADGLPGRAGGGRAGRGGFRGGLARGR